MSGDSQPDGYRVGSLIEFAAEAGLEPGDRITLERYTQALTILQKTIAADQGIEVAELHDSPMPETTEPRYSVQDRWV